MIELVVFEVELSDDSILDLTDVCHETFVEPYYELADIESGYNFPHGQVNLYKWVESVSKFISFPEISEDIKDNSQGDITTYLTPNKLIVKCFNVNKFELEVTLKLLENTMETLTGNITKIDITCYDIPQNIFKTTKDYLVKKEAFLDINFNTNNPYLELLDYYSTLHEADTNSEIIGCFLDSWGLAYTHPKDLAEEQLEEINKLFETLDWDTVESLEESREMIVEQLSSDPNFPEDIEFKIFYWEELDKNNLPN